MKALAFDSSIFRLINGAHTPWADDIMWIISTRWFFIPLYVFLLWLVYRKYRRQTVPILISVALMILVSDQLSVAVKNLVSRPRPCHNSTLSADVHLVNNKCGGLYGFYSSHASNTAALSMFLGLLLRNGLLTTTLGIWTFLVGYSRIYLGNHYPADILAGWIGGAGIAWVAFSLYQRYLKRLK